MRSAWRSPRFVAPVHLCMARQLVEEEGRRGEGAQAARGLRLPGKDSQAPADLFDHLGHRHRPPHEVDVTSPQADRLAPSEAEDAPDEHERPVPGRHRVGQPDQVSRIDQLPVRGPHPRERHLPGRPATDQVSVDCGVEGGAPRGDPAFGTSAHVIPARLRQQQEPRRLLGIRPNASSGRDQGRRTAIRRLLAAWVRSASKSATSDVSTSTSSRRATWSATATTTASTAEGARLRVGATL
jgi:hypothetical protein